MRSHPPALRKLVARTLTGECALQAGDHVLVAVSGGPDSMALLHVLGTLRSELDFSVSACGVDHGLRAEAAGELDVAAGLAAELNVPFVTRRVQVHPGGNLHARARDARYQALEVVRAELGAGCVATAHHADDRAETVLLRLLRGAPPQGLAVLSPRQGVLLRPMIRARRTQVEAHLKRHGVAFATDPSNLDPRFLRTRVRQELLPLLTELSPGVVGHLTTLADELAEGDLPSVVDEAGHELKLNRGQRSQLKFALRHRSSRTRVLLSGGRTLQVDPATGEPRVQAPGPSSSRPGSSSPDVAPLAVSGLSIAKHRPAGSKTSKSN